VVCVVGLGFGAWGLGFGAWGLGFGCWGLGLGGSCVGLMVEGAPLFQLLRRNVIQFRGGLVFKAHRLLYHSTLGLRVIKKKKKVHLSFASTAPEEEVLTIRHTSQFKHSHST